MKLESSTVRKIKLTDLDRLDPVSVFLEDFGPGAGQITIYCYGKAWTSYWGAMGSMTIAEFFCSCDEYYITKNLSSISSETYDIDTIQEEAGKRHIECWRDDPWNDYEFMNQMYGPDMYDWNDRLPKIANPDYRYLCRIILAVQEGLRLFASRVEAANDNG